MERTWKGIVAECGAKKREARGGDPCKLPAGHGTEHPGYGLCRVHGGDSPNAKLSAARAKEAAELASAVVTLGLDREVDPISALTEELWRTAGAVEWLRSRVADLDPDALGAAPAAALLQLYGVERDRLTKVAKTAIDVGLDQRQIALAERQGAILAAVIQAILRDLHLTYEQRQIAPAIARRHLLEIGSGE